MTWMLADAHVHLFATAELPAAAAAARRHCRAQAARGQLAGRLNFCLFLAEMAGQDDRRCYYVCLLVLVRHADDAQPLIAEGLWHGVWQQQPAGAGGFGYDPHFYLPQYGCTAAELAAERKNEISHRALALRELQRKMAEFAASAS